MKWHKLLQISILILICLVWFVNGFFCKVLNLVPRHQLIVSEFVGQNYATVLTKIIGVSEILMVVWIVSRIRPHWCACFQMLIVAIMNILEFVFVPDLLLFGRLNIIFASLFIVLIYVNEFVLTKTTTRATLQA